MGEVAARTSIEDDRRWMRLAIGEASLSIGGTRPNPPVGAVLVKDGVLISRGRHRRAGGPHAETDCLAKAGEAARGATLYVSLEPCSTAGRVGPCTEAILSSGVSRVVYAAADENPANAGRAADILRKAGVQVLGGVCKEKARRQLEPFFKFIRTGRPFVTLKMAQSLDGAIADHASVSKWITGEKSRREVANLRRTADAVLVGAGTILADDPSLLRKEEPEGGLPGARCALDVSGVISAGARIFTDGHVERTIIATNRGVAGKAAEDWERAGATVWDLPLAFPQQKKSGSAAEGSNLRLSLSALVVKFGREGFTHVLCEGGAKLASSLVSEGLVDEIHLFIAPSILGRPSLGTFGAFPHDLPTAPRFRIVSLRRFGEDVKVVLRPVKSASDR